MTPQNLLDLAKQGNAQAIDVLLNRVFQLNGITAKTTIKDGYLHLLLESAQVPNQQTLVPAIRGAMNNLGISTVHSLMIYGRQTGTEQPAWTQTVSLRNHADLLPLTPASRPVELPTPPEIHGSVRTSPTPESVTSFGPSLNFDQLPLIAEESLTNGTTYASGSNGAAPSTFIRQDIPSPSEAAAAEFAADDLLSVEPHLVLSKDQEPIPTSRELSKATRSTANLAPLRNVLLGLLGLMVLGILWLHNSVVAKQKTTIDAAQRLAASAGTANNARNLAALNASQQQLQQAVTLLESVPDMPASAHQQADQELVKVKAQLADIQQELDVEKQAQADLQSAEKLVATAMGLIQKAPRSLSASQQAEAKLQEAIRLLSAIPANTFVLAEAKQKLGMYKADYATVKEQIKAEQKEQQKQNSGQKSKGQEKRK